MTEEDGVVVTSGEANGFTLSELRFPAEFVQPVVDPESPYLAVVLEGGLEKSFRFRTMRFAHAAAFAMPAGAAHAARFGADGARIVVVKPTRDGNAPAGCLERLRELRGRGYSWLAWRLAGELRASDEAASLAAEAFALELLVAASRERPGDRAPGRRPLWLGVAEELLRARVPMRIGAVADAVGVHPSHLARVFRVHHGVSVGEYARRARLEWAAAELAGGETPLAVVATEAGFADQSHFTRVFKRYAGVTPARYRSETQRGRARPA